MNRKVRLKAAHQSPSSNVNFLENVYLIAMVVDMDPEQYFDRVVLINLKRRPDRLTRVLKVITESRWPFQWPEVFEGIDGEVVPCPPKWVLPKGAWGCLRSHQAVFERAITDNVKRLLILEDDVCFIDNFEYKVQEFLHAVPENWDQLMLGGEHVNVNGPPASIKPGVLRCTDCERTHCYAISGSFMKTLYQRWLVADTEYHGKLHCDQIMGRDPDLQNRHNVFAPEEFLAGQIRGRSDIIGGMHPTNFWNAHSMRRPIINLHCPPQVVAALRDYGIHTGYNRHPENDLDNGLIWIFSTTRNDPQKRLERLRDWIGDIQREIAYEPRLICTVWHPEADRDLVHAASNSPVLEITASSLSEALEKLPPEFKISFKQNLSRRCVINLKAPKSVLDDLRSRGWHNGYWRDQSSGMDQGIVRICRDCHDQESRIEPLAKLIRLLQQESETIDQGVAVIWHPDVDLEQVKAATSSVVFEIVANTVNEALHQWDLAKNNIPC